ncbi:uncharacterized protein [Ptychodera flava]|uniref:uncharacterized protein isoform X1 n=1 Tax=Ptychodera flava TaxID=63121 RepID=UPI00396A5B27
MKIPGEDKTKNGKFAALLELHKFIGTPGDWNEGAEDGGLAIITEWEKIKKNLERTVNQNAHGILLIPIIQRELNIFKDSIWNSHRSDHRGTLVYQLASRITSTIFQKSMTLKKVGGL